MKIQRKGNSVWTGSGKDGRGYLTTPSKVLNETPYSATSRFENGTGTNPEELIACAHAGCFNMALSFILAGAGYTSKKLDTTAMVTIENQNNSWSITSVNLDVTASIDKIDVKTFQELASDAKANCPVSKLLNTKITMNAKLA